MSGYKADLDKEILRCKDNGASNSEIIKRLFYYRRSPISLAHEDSIFGIFNEVSLKFKIPFKSIYVSGSAQTGHSLYKNKDFEESESDLDLAIVDVGLFQKYSEISYIASNNYRDQTKFSTQEKISDVPGLFLRSLATGYFRPDLMPICEEKNQWFRFFSQISSKHIDREFNFEVQLCD